MVVLGSKPTSLRNPDILCRTQSSKEYTFLIKFFIDQTGIERDKKDLANLNLITNVGFN